MVGMVVAERRPKRQRRLSQVVRSAGDEDWRRLFLRGNEWRPRREFAGVGCLFQAIKFVGKGKECRGLANSRRQIGSEEKKNGSVSAPRSVRSSLRQAAALRLESKLRTEVV